MDFFIANLAPIMFGTLVIFLLLGFPVAFALAANGILYGLVGIELGLFSASLFKALPQRVFGIVANDTLLAVPFLPSWGSCLNAQERSEERRVGKECVRRGRYRWSRFSSKKKKTT